MNKWTHSICDSCYQKLEPERTPTKMITADTEACCFCGKMHTSGIYYRADPAKTICQGKHD